jgi:hypothetical protein
VGGARSGGSRDLHREITCAAIIVLIASVALIARG